jgi:hypothetical protein
MFTILLAMTVAKIKAELYKQGISLLSLFNKFIKKSLQ